MPESVLFTDFFRMNTYYIYMLANSNNKVLYIGMTNDLKRRVFEHRQGSIEGFTKKYHCTKLVWYESTQSVESAILREKQMKKWKREFKENVINFMNPGWNDLYSGL
jgi:putative endonuclease